MPLCLGFETVIDLRPIDLRQGWQQVLDLAPATSTFHCGSCRRAQLPPKNLRCRSARVCGLQGAGAGAIVTPCLTRTSLVPANLGPPAEG